MTTRTSSEHSWLSPNRIAKRLFDLLVAATALVLLSPLLVALAILIRLDSKGPVLYRDVRAGRGGKPFEMLKFRSMVLGAEHMGLGRAVARDDPRITRVGRLLRQWTLDEIPQLINVLKGEMSIVGPRPATPEQMAKCSPQQCRRLEVKPGMAGWAWVHGRNDIPWSARIDMDLWYVDNWSFFVDLRIMTSAFATVFRRTGIYGPEGVTTDVEDAPVDADGASMR